VESLSYPGSLPEVRFRYEGNLPKSYHKPVQAFLSKIDPRLRFDRNYEALRPHTVYCEEIITLEE
jgi:hypothetical protein